MNKRQAEKLFKHEVLEWEKEHNDFNPKKDKPKAQMMWNEFTEMLHQNGEITEKQLYSWDNPNFIK